MGPAGGYIVVVESPLETSALAPSPSDPFTYNPASNPVMLATHMPTSPPPSLSSQPWAYYIRLFASRHLQAAGTVPIDSQTAKKHRIFHSELVAAYNLFTRHHNIPPCKLRTNTSSDAALCSQLDTLMGWKRYGLTKSVCVWYGVALHLTSPAEMVLTPPLPHMP